MIVYAWLFFLLASCTFCIVVHYRKTWICRVPKSLPCAFFRAHDKDTSCRVPQRKHTAKRKHSANPTLRRVPSLDTRWRLSMWQARAHAVRCRHTPWRRSFFAVCLHVAHGKAFFSPCAARRAHGEVAAPLGGPDGRQRLPCAQRGTRRTAPFAVCLASGTRRTDTLAVCHPSAHDKFI